MESVEKIDWALLEKQKMSLVNVLNNDSIDIEDKTNIEGILNLLDAMTDENYYKNNF
jgi:hypothetical protein